jgi:hypothetical protein
MPQDVDVEQRIIKQRDWVEHSLEQERLGPTPRSERGQS